MRGELYNPNNAKYSGICDTLRVRRARPGPCSLSCALQASASRARGYGRRVLSADPEKAEAELILHCFARLGAAKSHGD